MTTTQPTPVASPVGGRDLQLATRATRAVLDRVLADAGITFEQMAVLNTIEFEGGSIAGDALAVQLVQILKIDDAAARRAIAAVAEPGLVQPVGEQPEQLELAVAVAGRRLHADYSRQSFQISAEVWGGLPQEDLAATKRVLDAVTGRANAMLAAVDRERAGQRTR
jgi:DNA-binding MarR family transcriptional regulator